MLGTSWGQEGAKLVPAPGDPWYASYTYDPMNAPFSAPPTEVATVPPLVDTVAAVATQAGPEGFGPEGPIEPGSDTHGAGIMPGPEPGAVPPDGGGN